MPELSKYSHEDWRRAGEELERQRVRLNPRYRNRSVFCRERDINYRLSSDIENTARTNFDGATLAHIALAYGWEPGSIEAILSGGQPAPARPLSLSPADREVIEKFPDAIGKLVRDQENLRREANGG